MDVHVNLWAVLAGAASSMLVGAWWYSKPMVGAKWQKLVKLTDKDMQRGAPAAMGLAFLLSLVTAYVLVLFMEVSEAYFEVSQIEAGVMTAFWLWLGIVLTRVSVHDLFEQRPRLLTLMTVANELITLLVMGAVVGWLN